MIAKLHKLVGGGGGGGIDRAPSIHYIIITKSNSTNREKIQ